MIEPDDPLIGYGGVAELTGLRRATLRAYRAQGRMPLPDDATVADRPRWRASTITRWQASRPGRGNRLPRVGRA